MSNLVFWDERLCECQLQIHISPGMLRSPVSSHLPVAFYKGEKQYLEQFCNLANDVKT